MFNIFNFSLLSVMGIKDIFFNFFPIFKILRQAYKYNIAWEPDLIITIDAPEFNLRLASLIKKKWKNAKDYVSRFDIFAEVWCFCVGTKGTLHRMSTLLEKKCMFLFVLS